MQLLTYLLADFIITITLTHFPYTHTHTPVYHLPVILHTYIHLCNGPFSRTTQVSRYQRGKINLDITEARDSQRQWHQLGHMQASTSLQRQSTEGRTTTDLYEISKLRLVGC